MESLKDEDDSFYVKYHLDPLGSNRLEGLCWSFPYMRKRACNVGLRFIIFDTTHETNRFGAYLCIICIENELGESEVLFFAYIMHQVNKFGFFILLKILVSFENSKYCYNQY